MIAMGIFIFIEVDTTDFFTVCYSISQGMLFAVAGAYIAYLQAKVYFPKDAPFQQYGEFAMNKFGIGFWFVSHVK